MKARAINVIEAERGAGGRLGEVKGMGEVLRETEAVGELMSKGQIGLQVQALDYESQGKRIKCSKLILLYLSLGQAKLPTLHSNFKHLSDEVLDHLEAWTIELIKEGKYKGAGRMIRALEAWGERGGRTTRKRWHRIRLLHL